MIAGPRRTHHSLESERCSLLRESHLLRYVNDACASVGDTYTFVIRHEPTRRRGVQPSNPSIAQHPYTLLIVGHTHNYARLGQREAMFGNGPSGGVGKEPAFLDAQHANARKVPS